MNYTEMTPPLHSPPFPPPRVCLRYAMIPNVWNSCIYIMLVSYRDGSVFSLHEPGPTRGKVSRSRRVKRVLEGAKAAVGLLDCALHRAIGLTTPRWRKGVPVEVVVVHLARSNGGGGRRRAQDGRGGGGFHRPGRHRVHQAPSIKHREVFDGSHEGWVASYKELQARRTSAHLVRTFLHVGWKLRLISLFSGVATFRDSNGDTL